MLKGVMFMIEYFKSLSNLEDLQMMMNNNYDIEHLPSIFDGKVDKETLI